MKGVEENETVLTYKKIAQHIKVTASNLEMGEKKGFEIKAGNIRIAVPDTEYSVVYRVIHNPEKKLIAKKILKC